MFKNTFNLNGVDYKVVNGLVHTTSNCFLKSGQKQSILDPCYKGDSSVLDEYCRTWNLGLYDRPEGQHAYGHQTGQREKTLELAKSENIPPLEHGAQVTVTSPLVNRFWDLLFVVSLAVIGVATFIAAYEFVIKEILK